MKLLQAVILDWAGTMIDQGSLAPVRTIQHVFSRRGIAVSEADARRDMGLAKRDHIGKLLRTLQPGVNERDIDEYYAEFIPVQIEMLREHSDLVPGTREAAERIRVRGLKIGSTTGYTREMMDLLLVRADEQGYKPDTSLTPEDVGAGRPHPLMIYEAAVRLKAFPLWAFVKVGDTPADIEEGRNAGTWTVGVSDTGNSRADELERAGPHFVIGSVAEIDPVLDEIESRLAAGLRP